MPNGQDIKLPKGATLVTSPPVSGIKLPKGATLINNKSDESQAKVPQVQEEKNGVNAQPTDATAANSTTEVPQKENNSIPKNLDNHIKALQNVKQNISIYSQSIPKNAPLTLPTKEQEAQIEPAIVASGGRNATIEDDGNIIDYSKPNQITQWAQSQLEKLNAIPAFDGTPTGMGIPDVTPITPIIVAGKEVAKSILGSISGLGEGIQQATKGSEDIRIPSSQNRLAALELPAGLVKSGFSGLSLVVPQVAAFNLGIQEAGNVLPEKWVQAAMSPVSTILQETHGIVNFNGKIYDLGNSDGVKAAAELTDLVWDIFLFKKAEGLGKKIIHNEVLTPIEQAEANKIIDEGIKDFGTPFKKETLNKIPPELPDAVKIKVAPLIEEKEKIIDGKQNIDVGLHQLEDQKIADINEQIIDHVAPQPFTVSEFEVHPKENISAVVGKDAEYKGKIGVIEKDDEGNFVFNDGKRQQILPVENKVEPTETISDSGLTVAKEKIFKGEIPVIVKQGDVEYRNRKYFVSFTNDPKDATGTRVYEYTKDKNLLPVGKPKKVNEIIQQFKDENGIATKQSPFEFPKSKEGEPTISEGDGTAKGELQVPLSSEPKTTDNVSDKPPVSDERQQESAPIGEAPSAETVVSEEVKAPEEKVDEAKQFAIDMVNNDLVEPGNTSRSEMTIKGSGKKASANIEPRLDLGMSSADKNKAIADIKKGNYETAPAKKLIQKLSEFHKNDAFEMIRGTGGNADRFMELTLEEMRHQIEDMKEFKAAEAMKGIPDEEAQAIEDFVRPFEDEHGNINFEEAIKHLDEIGWTLPEGHEERISDLIKKIKDETGKREVQKGEANSSGSVSSEAPEGVIKDEKPRTREQILQELEQAKAEHATAESDYNKAKDALDKNLQGKQGDLLQGNEQKLFDDTSEMKSKADAAKKTLDAAKEKLDAAQKLADDNLPGQQEILSLSHGLTPEQINESAQFVVKFERDELPTDIKLAKEQQEKAFGRDKESYNEKIKYLEDRLKYLSDQKNFDAEVEKIKSKYDQPTSLEHEAKNLADKIRGLKGKPLMVRDSVTGEMVEVKSKSFFDEAIDIVANLIEKAGKELNHTKLGDAIVAGLKHIRSSEWYKKLKFSEKQGVIKEFKAMFAPMQEALVKGRKEDLKKRTENTTGQRDLSEKIKTTARRIFRQNEISFKRGVGAERKGQSIQRKEFAAAIADLLKSNQLKGEITPAQFKTIIKAATNIGTEAQLNRFLTFSDRVISDANYAQRISDISATRKKLGSRDYGTLTNTVKSFLAINPRSVPLDKLDLYERVINGLAQKRVPSATELVRNYNEIADAVQSKTFPSEGKSYNDIEDGLAELTQAKFDNVDDYIKARQQLAALNRGLQKLINEGSITPEESAQAQDLFMQTGKTLEEHAAENLLAEEVKLKDEMITEAKMIASNQELADFTPEQKKYIEKFQSIPESLLKQMPIEDVDAYVKVMDGLDDGLVNSKMYELLNKAGLMKATNEIKGQVLDQAINKTGKAIKVLGQKIEVPNPKKLFGDLTTRGKYFWDEYFGLGGQKPIWKTIVSPILRAYNHMQLDAIRLRSEYHTASKKVNSVDKAKISIVLNQLDYQSNPIRLEDKTVHDFADLPNQEKDYFKVINNPDNAMLGLNNVRIADQKIAREAYTELPKDSYGNIDTQKALDELNGDPDIKALLDTVQKIKDALEDKNRVATEKRGDVYVPRENYHPRMVRQSRPRGGLFDTEPLTAEQAVESLLGKPVNNVTARAGSTHARTDYRYYVSYNLDHVIGNHIQDVLRDYHLGDPMKQRLGALGSLMLSQTGGKQATARALYEAMKDGVVTSFHLDNKVANDDMKLIEKVLSTTRTLALARPTRLINDFASNFVRETLSSGQINPGRHEAYKQLLDNSYSSLMFKAGKYAEERYETNQGAMRKLADAIIPFADTPVTRAAFAGAFDTRFETLTGERFNPDEYVKSEAYRDKFAAQIDDASSHAEASMSQKFNAQTPFAAASKTKWTPLGSPKEKYSLISQALGFLNSWNANDTRNLLTKAKQLYDGSGTGRMDALRDISGVLASNYVYTTTAILVANIIKNGIASALDDDEKGWWQELGDDFEKGFSDTFNTETQGEVGVGTVLSLAMGRYGNLFRGMYALISGILANGLKDNPAALSKLDAVNGGMTRTFYADPIKSDSRTVDMLRLIPAMGEIAAQVYQGSSSAIALTNKVANDGFESLNASDKDLWTTIQATNYLIGAAFPNPISPEFHTESRRIASAVIQDEKNDRMRAIGVYDIYEKAKANELIPPIAPNTVTIDGEKRTLTYKEHEEFNDLVMKYRKEWVDDLRKNDPEFKKAPQKEKIKMIKSAYASGYNEAKDEFFNTEEK